MRSEARLIQRVIAAFTLLSAHRGGEASKAGSAFVTALSSSLPLSAKLPPSRCEEDVVEPPAPPAKDEAFDENFSGPLQCEGVMPIPTCVPTSGTVIAQVSAEALAPWKAEIAKNMNKIDKETFRESMLESGLSSDAIAFALAAKEAAEEGATTDTGEERIEARPLSSQEIVPDTPVLGSAACAASSSSLACASDRLPSEVPSTDAKEKTKKKKNKKKTTKKGDTTEATDAGAVLAAERALLESQLLRANSALTAASSDAAEARLAFMQAREDCARYAPDDLAEVFPPD